MKKKTAQPRKTSGPRFVIVRGSSSGVQYGEFVSCVGQHVKLKNTRRFWYWTGAATLSNLAMVGTLKPETCKFPAPVEHHEILDVIEILDVTPAARATFDKVVPWVE